MLGNKGVTTFANVMFNSYIADLETCFKLMPLDLLRSLRITSEGFGMEAEITGKLLARGIRPFEVPITYRARSREAGKKITWKDGVEAIWILARVRLGAWRSPSRWPAKTGLYGSVDRRPVGPVGEAEPGGGQVTGQHLTLFRQPDHDPADVQGAQVRLGLRDLRPPH